MWKGAYSIEKWENNFHRFDVYISLYAKAYHRQKGSVELLYGRLSCFYKKFQFVLHQSTKYLIYLYIPVGYIYLSNYL